MLESKKLLKVSDTSCSSCGFLLIKTHSRRKLKDLEATYSIDSEIKRCGNADCPCYGVRIYPIEYSSLIYPKSDYSLPLYAVVGYQRLNEHKTVKEIQGYMKETYADLEELKERTIENIYKRVEVCLGKRQCDKERLRTVLLSKGVDKLCLTIDGIAPEQGNSIMYVIREVTTQELIFVRYLEHSDAAHLSSDLFEPLKAFVEDLGFDISAWICDKQNGFISTLSTVFEGVPIHLCQAHFLKAIGKPVQAADSELAKEVKKNYVR